MLTQLTTEKIIEIHDEIIRRTGGTLGIIDIGTIEHSLYRTRRTKDIFTKAAIMMESIIARHPFTDGNKRTGFEIADYILRLNGYFIDVSADEAEQYLLEIADYKHTFDGIREWIRSHSKKF